MTFSIKKIIKSFIRWFYKLRISFHKEDSLIVDNAYEKLKEVYDFHPYGSDLIKNIDEYDFDLSLIVPVYNDSLYLNECIDSLLKQNTNYQYEIIAIDDGSSDNSLELLNEYQDQKLKVVHQDNKGISITRNNGLKLSKGRYVGFVDNDDKVSDNYVNTLLENAYKYQADIVRCGYQTFYSDSKKVYSNISFPFEIIDENNSLNYYPYDGYIWSGIQKRELWNNFGFPKNYWYEDMITKMYLYSKCKLFVNIQDIIYFKRIHEKNASNSVWNDANVKCIDQLYLAILLEDKKKKEGIQKSLLSYYLLLDELGYQLVNRTKNLAIEVRKMIFRVACEYLIQEYKDFNVENDYVLKNVEKALKNQDFTLWNLIAEYQRFS